MTPLSEQLLEYLRQRPDPIGKSRIVEDLRKPEHQIDAALSELKRDGYVCQPQPGMWEARHGPAATPAALERKAAAIATFATLPAARDPNPPSSTPTAAPAETTDDQETTMSYKKCEQCEEKKGPRAFNKGKQICRECEGGTATPANGKTRRQGGGRKKSGNGAGAYSPSLDQLCADREEAVARVTKIDAAIAALEALG